VIDSQSAKTAGPGGRRGYDAGKKVKGRKRHAATDSSGLPLAVAATSAGVSDSRAGRLLLLRLRRRCPKATKVWADQGYKRGFVEWAEEMLGIAVEIVKREGKGFRLLPRRWVGERTFAWTGQYRRTSKEYEHNPLNAEAVYTATGCNILLKKLIPT
jgi:putative transposase